MIPSSRLRNQYLSKPFAGTAADLVSWFGAVQAQEYEHARWGIGLRLAGRPTAADIEEEIARGAILRTHVLRPTWHFVAASDLRWMLALTAPRVHARMAPYNRHLELDSKTLARATAVIERACGDSGCVTRAELGHALKRARIAIDPIRLAHIAMHAELEGVVCSGPRRDRLQTYALVSARAPRSTPKDRDDALGELACRFFQSHGPATIRDFVWWSGLTTPDAKRGVDLAGAKPLSAHGLTYWIVPSAPSETLRPRPPSGVHLLPIYDEYLVAYRDREAVPHGPNRIIRNGRAVGFQHALVIDGQVAGTWRTSSGARNGAVEVTPMRRLSAQERMTVLSVTRRYARFGKTLDR